MTLVLGLVCGLFLAFANGANDNFKGVATLFGSHTTDYRKALLWATATTVFGSLMALIWAKGLVVTFSGKGLVPDAARLLDGIHYLSAGIVSFARGLNDTPKIAALLLVGNLFDPGLSIIGIAVAMAVGGLLSARRVAQTMSFRVTDMNPGQGLTANLMTGILAILGSGAGLPLSTTHVSCGSLFGIGATTGRIQWNTLTSILLSWFITLPVAATLGYLVFFVLEGLF